MLYYYKRNYFGGRDLDQFGYLQGIRTQSIFIREQARDAEKNHISGFLDDQGRWCNTDDEVASVAEKYFKNLFTSTTPTNLNLVLDSVNRVVTPDMNQTLHQPYTRDEVKQALFHMHPSKSPGLDVMSPFLFQKYWHIISNDVTNVVLFVLNSAHMLHKMNYTYIVLIPKKDDPKNVFDYQPISLCNVVSRIVSKVLANRLKLILPNVISNAQSAFVPNRLIKLIILL